MCICLLSCLCAILTYLLIYVIWLVRKLGPYLYLETYNIIHFILINQGQHLSIHIQCIIYLYHVLYILRFSSRCK